MARKVALGCCGAIIIATTSLHYPAHSRSAYEQDYECLVKYRKANAMSEVPQACRDRGPSVVRMLDHQVDQAYDQVHDYQRKLDTECRVAHKDPDKIRLQTKKSFFDGITSKLPHI